jgi:hypothetical protein
VKQSNKPFLNLLSLSLCLSLIALSGCAVEPSFPGSQIEEKIKSICKELYGLDVLSQNAGGTIGAMLYLDSMLDEAGTQIPKDIHVKLGNLTSVVSRVALSTDQDINFIVVGIRGRSEGIELLIIRNIYDIKKAQTEALSITESMKRTVFKQSRYDVKDVKGEVFELKDLSLEDFVIQQILQRVRYADDGKTEKKDDDEEEAPAPEAPQELFDGRHIETSEGIVFDLSLLSFDTNNSLSKLQQMLIDSKDVFEGYKFKDYDKLIVRDLLNGRKVELDRQTMDMYISKQITIESIMDQYLEMDTNRSSMFKNALEVFGVDGITSNAQK